MSTEVEQQPAPAVAPITEENGVPAAEATTAPNGETATEEKKQNGKAKKEPELAKDPKEDFSGWLKQQNNKAVHKADYLLISGVIDKAFPEGATNKPSLPENGFVTKREFVDKLKDGFILAHLANTLKPGAVEQIKEGEEVKSEENQKANVDAFLAVAKEFIAEDQLFTFEDLKKGKEHHQKIFNALLHLLYKTESAEIDQFIKEIGEVEPEKFLNKLKDRFISFAVYTRTLVTKPFTRSNSQTEQPATEEQNGKNGVHTNNTTETSHEENGVSNGTKVEEKKEEQIPAVAAN